MTKIVIYHSKECDPKRCTSVKLQKQNKVFITHNMRKIPYNAIVLDAEASKAVSIEDKDKITKYGDLDGNGKIDIEDYARFTHYIAGMSNSNIKREGYAEHNYDDDTNTNNLWKYNHVVTVSKGDNVTYKIKLMNDGETDVYITKVKDFFPNGVTFGNRTFNGNEYDVTKIVDENGIEF